MGNGALSGGTKETSTVPPPSSGIQAIDLKQARSVLRQTMESSQAPKILRNLEPAEVAALAEASDPVCFQSGQVVVKQNDCWPYFCTIVHGRVQVSKTTRGVLGTMSIGQWFGDLKSEVALASVITTEKSLLFLITLDEVQAVRDRMHHDRDLKSTSDCIDQVLQTGRSGGGKQPKLSEIEFVDLLIGQGTFGKVYLGVDSSCNAYAIKCISKAKVVQFRAQQQTNNEVRLLSQIKHPFIVKLDATLQDESTLFLLMEFVPGGEFFRYLVKKRTVLEPHAQFYMANVFLALEHLHAQGIIFRDLKPENLVFSVEGYLKLVDFGFAKKLSSPSAQAFTICGTPDYIAPEIVSGKGHGKEVDYWSAGVFLYEMLTGKPPYSDPSGNVYRIYERILHSRLSFPANVKLSTNVKAYISALLFPNPNKRLGSDVDGFNDIKQHEWFTESSFRWSSMAQMEIEAPYKPNPTVKHETVLSFPKVPYHMVYDKLLPEQPTEWL